MKELLNCPICKGDRREMIYPATVETQQSIRPEPYSGHYQINACLGCGLLYSSPVPDAGHVHKFYREYESANVVANEIDNVRHTMRGYYQLVAPYLTRKEYFLDIGCDIGLLLESVRTEGFSQLYGVEPIDSVRSAALRRVPDAIISEKFYEQIEFERDTFDLITFIHVLDHLIGPDKALNRAFSQLKPGGICLAVVHDVNSLLARLTGERFPPFNYLHHFFFSKRTLRMMFEACGFEVLRVTSTVNVYSLAFFVERAPLLPAVVRSIIAHATRTLGFGRLPLSVPVGNIAVVARKPTG